MRMVRFLHLFLIVAILAATAAWPAQARELHQWIVEPVRSDTPFGGERFTQWLAQVGSPLERLARDDGPELAFAVLEPRDYRLDYRYRRRADEMGMSFEFHSAAPRLPAPVRGTVVLLHGWTMDASTQGLWGMALAEHGYRAVLLDLRNHGFSGQAPAGYGTREADDVLALIAHLRAHKRLAEPVHLFGTSYGAVTALQAAARSPGIAGVVAMEPYANAADSIRQYAALLKAGDTGGLRGRLLAWWLRATLQDAELESALDRAGEELQLDLRALDTADALAAVRGCVLLLHGARDRLVPVASARELARTPARLHYVELPDENHFSLPARIDWLREPVRQWLAAAGQAGAGGCPTLSLPADPLH